MSIAIMAQVWPLKIPTTDKMVLLALADAANDEGHTWIAVKSRTAFNRAGLPKLNLLLKTSLSERAIQMALRRLENAKHISRKEKLGVGVDYWVHPVTSTLVETPARNAPPHDMRPASHSSTPAAAAGPPRTRCAQTIKIPKQSSAGAREARSRQARPPAGPSDGPAAATLRPSSTAEKRADEGDREKQVRDRILIDAKGEPNWLATGALKVCALSDDDGPVGLEVFVLLVHQDTVQQLSRVIERSASAALGVQVKWVRVDAMRPTRG